MKHLLTNLKYYTGIHLELRTPQNSYHNGQSPCQNNENRCPQYETKVELLD